MRPSSWNGDYRPKACSSTAWAAAVAHQIKERFGTAAIRRGSGLDIDMRP
jgi:hypothetical protein